MLADILSPKDMQRTQALVNDPNKTQQRNILLGIAQELGNDPAPPGKIQRFLMGQFINAVAEPQLMLNNMLEQLPLAMFVLLPIFALILKLIYLRTHKYYVEHLVFSTHLHSFTFLMYGVLLLLPVTAGSNSADFIADRSSQILGLVLMVYHLTALKRYYLEGWIRTCFKFTVQMSLYAIVLLPVSAVTVLMLRLATL